MVIHQNAPKLDTASTSLPRKTTHFCYYLKPPTGEIYSSGSLAEASYRANPLIQPLPGCQNLNSSRRLAGPDT